jgi:hypothetical protein
MKYLFVLLLLLSSNSFAAECTAYELSHPAFLLTGAHLSTGKCSTCASCHKGGVFMGTPNTCNACHTGDPRFATVSITSNHVPIGVVSCSNCHNTTTFDNAHMSHSSVSSFRCDSCHTGTYSDANGKPRDHLATTADCKVCHGTSSWSVSHAAIHLGVTTGCVTCHNNQVVAGKPLNHPVTSDVCETCHSINNHFNCI